MKKGTLILDHRVIETPDVVTLYFRFATPEDAFTYEAGQYLHLILDGRSKMYSISSAPHEPFITVTVKKKRDFSVLLHNLESGDTIGYLGPTGFFTRLELTEQQRSYPMVMIGGSVGVSPLYSIAKSYIVATHGEVPVTLFYANRNQSSTPLYKEIEKLASDYPNFTVHHHWSGDLGYRLDANLIQETLGNLEHCVFYLCGSTPFVDDFWKSLRELGVPEENLFAENFFPQ